MYAWVCGTPDDTRELAPLNRGVLYIGVDQSSRGGRTQYESSGRGGWHGLGLAMKRTEATVLAGPVVAASPLSPHTALGEGARAEFAHEVPDGLRQLRADVAAGRTVAAAERVAVRLCMHIGTIGAAVNSQFASAWKVGGGLKPYDDLAYWAADALRTLTPSADGGANR